MRAQLALAVACGIISPASSLTLESGSSVTAGQVSGIYSEMERRCKDGDVDGATQAGLIWWKPKGRRLSKSQLTKLLDVCLAQHGMLGEGDKCALGSQKQCEWARNCVKTKDCEDPPLAEMLMQMKEFVENGGVERAEEEPQKQQEENKTADSAPSSLLQKDQISAKGNGDKVTVDDAIYWLKTRPEMVYPPGTWISRCPACNLALNIAWWAKEDGRTLYDMPFYSSLDRILWDMIIPYIAKNTKAPRQKLEVELEEIEATTPAPPEGMPKAPKPTAQKRMEREQDAAEKAKEGGGDKKEGGGIGAKLGDLKDRVMGTIQKKAGDKIYNKVNEIVEKVKKAAEPSKVK